MSNNSDELAGIRKLYEFSRLVLKEDDQEELLDRLVAAIRSITDADEVMLFQLEQGEAVVQAVATDKPGGENEETPPKYSKTLVDAVIEEGTLMLLEDVCHDPRFEEASSVQALAISSALGAPLYHQGELMGVIYASRHRIGKNFTEEHRDLMTVVASQASLLMGQIASAKAQKKSESRYRSLVEMSPSSILVIRDGRVQFANQTACELWRRQSVDELCGLDVEELFDSWRSRSLLEELRNRDSFDPVDAWARIDDDDTTVPVEVVGRPGWSGSVRVMQLIVSEVGEKKDVLAQRVRADRLTVMGTMAATIGHEINNPLSYVYANLDFAVEELERHWGEPDPDIVDERTRDDVVAGLRSARKGTERIRAVVDGIQNFTRLDDEGPTVVTGPLKSSLRIARSKLEPDVELEVELRATDPVPLSASRLGQVFLNILVNGAQALSEGTGDGEGDKTLEVRTFQKTDEVIVEIADNGPGISPEVGRHIFEPFVSTKSSEAGTGLGLAICRDIIDRGGGRIEVESEPGEGSLFRISLPAAQESVPESLEILPDNEGRRRGQILVVDPEVTLGKSLQRVLQGQHDVTLANSMDQAEDLLADADRFDVILCDLRMRGGVGRDLFRWVEDHAPHYWDRLVAMTASRGTQANREYLKRLPNPWLAKPFDLDRLRAIIGGLLEADGESCDAG